MVTEKEGSMQLEVELAQDVEDTCTVYIDVPINASRDEIVAAAKEAALRRSSETTEAGTLLSGDTLSGIEESTFGLRISSIYSLNGEWPGRIAGNIPVEDDYGYIGQHVAESADYLKSGIMSDAQFMLETLRNVIQHTPKSTSRLKKSPEVLEHYAEEALADTNIRLGDLLEYGSPAGNLQRNPGKMVLTMKLNDGSVGNRIVLAPAIILNASDKLPVFVPYHNPETNASVLVFSNLAVTDGEPPVVAVAEDGSSRLYASSEDLRNTGMQRVFDYDLGQKIILRIVPLMDCDNPVADFGGEEYGVQQASHASVRPK